MNEQKDELQSEGLPPNVTENMRYIRKKIKKEKEKKSQTKEVSKFRKKK